MSLTVIQVFLLCSAKIPHKFVIQLQNGILFTYVHRYISYFKVYLFFFLTNDQLQLAIFDLEKDLIYLRSDKVVQILASSLLISYETF